MQYNTGSKTQANNYTGPDVCYHAGSGPVAQSNRNRLIYINTMFSFRELLCPGRMKVVIYTIPNKLYNKYTWFRLMSLIKTLKLIYTNIFFLSF